MKLSSVCTLSLVFLGQQEHVFVSALAGIATKASPALLQEALAFFLEQPEKAVVTPTSSGVNNVVQYVKTPEYDRDMILRIYNNGNNRHAVDYEHGVLAAVDRTMLPFQVPEYLPSKTGRTVETLSTGTQCCIGYRIPGVLPKTSDPMPLGQAVGQLMGAMARIPIDDFFKNPSTQPYNLVYHSHKGVGGDKNLYYDYCQRSEFDDCREAITKLNNYFDGLDRRVQSYVEKQRQDPACLPIQVIHGDLHYDNVLVDPETSTVTGLLDFEFCTVDWRACELAVTLSKYVGEKDPFPLVDRFLEGYCQNGVPLTDMECEILPDLINLRVMSNCVYFVGRAVSGQDTIDSLTSRAGMYADRVLWVDAHRDEITQAIRQRMQQSRGAPVPAAEN